jgi:hypothetical protein
MSERQTLLNSIAATTSDYRAEEGETPTPERVERWVKQFDPAAQLPILREMDHLLKKTYFSRKTVSDFLNAVLTAKGLVGDDPCAFWKNVKFLSIQGGGGSQREMLAVLDTLLVKKCGYSIDKCGMTPSSFLYLDDGIFTGNRIRRDLEEWLADDAPAEAKVYVVTMALHSGGWHYVKTRVKKYASECGKKIELDPRCILQLEDRKSETYSSDVLRPTTIPEDGAVKEYVKNMRFPPVLRKAGSTGTKGLYSNDNGRQLLEQEFLKAGAKIRNLCPNLGDTQRPLGHMTLDTLGFGSLIVTFRNCPNNAPLALWAGDPWYPLFPRTTNSETSLKRFMEMLAKEEE